MQKLPDPDQGLEFEKRHDLAKVWQVPTAGCDSGSVSPPDNGEGLGVRGCSVDGTAHLCSLERPCSVAAAAPQAATCGSSACATSWLLL